MNGMRTLVALSLLVGILLLAETHWRPAVAQEQDKVADKFSKLEYKVLLVADGFERDLNALGNKGWDYAGTVKDGNDCFAVLKRAKR